MIVGQDGAGGGSDHDPFCGRAGALPERAARGGDGRVSLRGGGREFCFFVGKVALRRGQLRLADLAILYRVV